jgi:hypothetical protein
LSSPSEEALDGRDLDDDCAGEDDNLACIRMFEALINSGLDGDDDGDDDDDVCSGSSPPPSSCCCVPSL